MSTPTPTSAKIYSHEPVWDAKRWLPTTADEVSARGWDYVDVVIVSGDAYVDHPAFGTAVIGRLLESEGLRVAILPQPNWRDDLRDFKKFGAPRLFFGVTAGCMDSMVNRYTAAKKLRSEDAYTPGGAHGFRPDYATTVYSQILKKLFPEVPVMIGGIEASLRRVTHFDYWSDTLKPSILAESGADLLVYGMGELPLRETVRLLKRGVPFASLTTIPQTAVLLPPGEDAPKNKNWDDYTLHSHEECQQDRALYSKNFKDIETESNRVKARRLLQPTGERLLVVNPPFPTMTEEQIDAAFDLPYTRLPHPKYRKRGPIPAYEMIKHSLNMHRGCFGGCSFCTISAHQGKFVASRSKASILREVESIKQMPDFRGTISDLGGPSANMYKMKGKEQWICDECVRPSCIWPDVCRNLDTDHTALLDIYESVRNTEGVKHAYVASGIRYDLFLHDKGTTPEVKASHEKYIEELAAHHVPGRIKVAPEHTSDHVLRVMRKPSFNLFYKFKEKFEKAAAKAGKPDMPVTPYFISSHPGSRPEDMADLALKTKDLGYRLEAVQDFTPTPMTVATEIYATGVHPYDGKPVACAHTPEEKQQQRSFFFWYKPEMKAALRSSMQRLGLDDLAARLLDEKKKTRDVTPTPHIAPCGMQAPGSRLAAATAKPKRSRKPAHLDEMLREAGVKTAKDQPPSL
ncbi:YgiQ family radical SAM protein [Oleiharenicola lentus]|uniref:YgiQ family radical SAM protein n=1 Tax=Oleiharenicola lentus TaxID=2508720 RepID=A0A4V1M6C8_9BACT|nr:YgiQ family radical SAM protein [Oleiharenicola lentus]RXK54949.1 YgiQ family radical SAM protein [Oleiharenicola lentus]